MSDKKYLPCGIAYEELTDEESRKLRKYWFMYADGIINANGLLPKNFLKFADKFYNLNWQPKDILINTFPKSGTTWTQEIIWNLTCNPDLDNPLANTSLDARFPCFDADMYLATTGAPVIEEDGDIRKLFDELCPGSDWRDGLLLQLAYVLPPPRMLKAHIDLQFFPSDITNKCKVLYVLRDPRDVICSMFHYSRLQVVWGFSGDLDEFIDEFINDEIPYGPYWEHIKKAWSKKDDPNICIVFYEDLKADINHEIRRIDKFLGTNITDAQMEAIAKFTAFDQLKERSKDNPPTSNDCKFFNTEVLKEGGTFFRKGIVGDWKNKFTEAQAKRVNEWMAHNLKSFSDDFKYKV